MIISKLASIALLVDFTWTSQQEGYHGAERDGTFGALHWVCAKEYWKAMEF